MMFVIYRFSLISHLLKVQSRAFVGVVFEWLVGRIIAKISLERGILQVNNRREEAIHRGANWYLFT
jgi:hypothetical protein